VVAITSPPGGAVFAAGTPVSFAGTFTDNDGETHTALWTFNSISHPGTINEISGEVHAVYTFDDAGVYLVRLTITDSLGMAGTASAVNELAAMVVIYDPDAGYVTGGGWIDSPYGAYTADPGLTGKAGFGFVSKYEHGGEIPTGQTEFRFRMADLNFQSTTYEWLVVAGSRAQYKGVGTINGAGDYGFMLTAIDEQINGGGGVDKFRIKIWDKNNSDSIVYDNQINSPNSSDPTTVLRGGNVIIHRQQ
jgi:hypothetical protein